MFYKVLLLKKSDVVLTFTLPSKHMSKVKNRNSRKRLEICLKLTIMTPERPYF